MLKVPDLGSALSSIICWLTLGERALTDLLPVAADCYDNIKYNTEYEKIRPTQLTKSLPTHNTDVSNISQAIAY